MQSGAGVVAMQSVGAAPFGLQGVRILILPGLGTDHEKWCAVVLRPCQVFFETDPHIRNQPSVTGRSSPSSLESAHSLGLA